MPFRGNHVSGGAVRGRNGKTRVRRAHRLVRLPCEAGGIENPIKILAGGQLSELELPVFLTSEALVILAPLQKPEGDLLFRSKVQDLAKFKGGERLYRRFTPHTEGNYRVQRRHPPRQHQETQNPFSCVRAKPVTTPLFSLTCAISPSEPENKAVSHRKYRIIAADRAIDAAESDAAWRKWMDK